jgi:hypothetical protein
MLTMQLEQIQLHLPISFVPPGTQTAYMLSTKVHNPAFRNMMQHDHSPMRITIRVERFDHRWRTTNEEGNIDRSLIADTFHLLHFRISGSQPLQGWRLDIQGEEH